LRSLLAPPPSLHCPLSRSNRLPFRPGSMARLWPLGLFPAGPRPTVGSVAARVGTPAPDPPRRKRLGPPVFCKSPRAQRLPRSRCDRLLQQHRYRGARLAGALDPRAGAQCAFRLSWAAWRPHRQAESARPSSQHGVHRLGRADRVPPSPASPAPSRAQVPVNAPVFLSPPMPPFRCASRRAFEVSAEGPAPVTSPQTRVVPRQSPWPPAHTQKWCSPPVPPGTRP